MSHQSTQHRSLINSIPPTHHHQPNLTSPIKSPSNDNDDDEVVFLCSVPKVIHTPEEYDPKCKCTTCKLVKKLLAECTCEECRGQQQTNQVDQTEGQVAQSSENVESIHNQVSFSNAQQSDSSIQNNDDTSTSEHVNGNDQDDDRESRSSTPDYLPRFFDDESGVSESESECSVNDNSRDPDYVFDDNEDDDLVDDYGDETELDQESENNDDDDEDDQDYAPSKQSSSKFLTEFRPKSSPKRVTKPCKTLVKRAKCPQCNVCFTTKRNLLRHDREIHKQLKSFYCKWPKCDYSSGRREQLNEHITVKHFNHRKDANNAQTYIGKCEASAQENYPSRLNCSLCRRNVQSGQLKYHLSIHKKSGYRCTWSGCAFFFAQLQNAKKHICTDHLQAEMANSRQTNQYLVKVNPRTGQTRKVLARHASQTVKSGNLNCLKCGRNFHNKGLLARHFRTHSKSGLRCLWIQCGFFFSERKYAKRHILREHYKDKLVNSTQINQHLVEVNLPISLCTSKIDIMNTDGKKDSNSDFQSN